MEHGRPSTFADRIVRYDELQPQTNSFIDRRTPGNTDQETFCVIGPGVIENKKRHFVHIGIPHGFNMGGARQSPGCSNSQHSHETAETFIVHHGTFTFYLGPNREDGELELTEGDVISIPMRVFRGFRNTGDSIGHLVSTIGENDPGQVTWAPYVFEEAKSHGLFLLESGNLVDTADGQILAEDAKLFPPTTEEDLKNFRRLTAGDMTNWIAFERDLSADDGSPLAGEGVEECPVIGPANVLEGLSAAPISAPHGFHIRRVRMQSQADIPAHFRNEPEVIFVHRGELVIDIDDEKIFLRQGDYFTLPIGVYRSWRNPDAEQNNIHVVRGGNRPGAPVWREAV